MGKVSFRPTSWEEYIGQEDLKNNLKITITASQLENRAIDHILLSGPAGVGKTSLAYLIGVVLKTKTHILHGPNLQKPSDLICVLTLLKDFEVVFIDEIHAISKEVSELLYPVLEDNTLNLIIGKDYNSKNINITLPKFTLIGATTNLYHLSHPLIQRFPINLTMSNYNLSDLQQIIFNCAAQQAIRLGMPEAYFIAQHSRFNPRIAINLFKRIYDYALTTGSKIITIALIKVVFKNLQIYLGGISKLEINYLWIINNTFSNKPTGIELIAQVLNEPVLNITNSVEPLLLKLGFLQKTNRGRVITTKGQEFLQKINFKKFENS
ncbi:Holliday junction branch migration DNA helicase RuvB [Spiroplasma chrysopicola]|uniref:Holliday junction branch migration complex subunit RuvB n=1 Tax=Spiroplasma chrysopicola DF-1 TaxID=1276227 RepID=R4UG90_9MOLU|nr:Holliday junction branch migration DNA helicase RuvB [Spiroplasma chrysopicola]AGM25125.1 Holliday junction DNA helicase RuvB [Spiroplasma chrysopicola DF-1]